MRIGVLDCSCEWALVLGEDRLTPVPVHGPLARFLNMLCEHALKEYSKSFYFVELNVSCLVGWLCLTSHQQRGHLETAPPFTVPCEGREAR